MEKPSLEKRVKLKSNNHSKITNVDIKQKI